MAADPVPPPPPPPSPARLVGWERYRSQRTHLLVVRLLLGLTSVAAGGFIVIAGRALEFDDWSTEAGRRAGEVAVVAGVVLSLCFVASYAALAIWCGRMYRNLFAFGSGDLRFTPGWGVGAWFVPFLNLFRPKQIVNDLWRATDPEVGPSSSWHDIPVIGAVHVWWALLLVSMALVPSGHGDGGLPDPECVTEGIFGAVCTVLFCGFSWFVTSELTNRMESLAARRGQLVRVPRRVAGGPTRDRVRRRSPLTVLCLAAVGLVAGAVVPIPKVSGSASLGAVAPEVSAPLDTVGTRPTSIFDLEVGDCVELRSPGPPAARVREEVDMVDVVACDAPHTYELIDVIVHAVPSGATFPGNDAVARSGSEQCAEHFEGIVGTPFLQSELDILPVTPTKDSWGLGDREIQCLAFRMDGRSLDDTVVGSGM